MNPKLENLAFLSNRFGKLANVRGIIRTVRTAFPSVVAAASQRLVRRECH
jgi:hypothetical protein